MNRLSDDYESQDHQPSFRDVLTEHQSTSIEMDRHVTMGKCSSFRSVFSIIQSESDLNRQMNVTMNSGWEFEFESEFPNCFDDEW